MLSKRITQSLVVGILLACSSALILSNLGNIYLWQDEAQTALVAKTILTHGVPLGYDGKNYFSQLKGAEYGKNYVWKWHPWLPFYVLAGFFAVFGTSTFVARLPFALFGIGTIALTYFYGVSLWKVRRAAVLAAVVLLTSVPFLLLVRQCRYYAPAAFFSLAGLYAYSQMLERRRNVSTAFVISAVLLFHTQYVYYAALLAAVLAHALVCRRDKLKLVSLLSLVTIAINLPWIIWFSSMGGVVGDYGNLAHRIVVCLGWYANQIAKHVFNPILLLLPLFVFGIARIRRVRSVRDRETHGNLLLLLVFSASVVVGISITNQYPYFRYLAPLIPVACLIAGLILEQGMRIHPALGISMLVLLVWRGQMADYLYEITHDYDGPVEAIVCYLNENADPHDVVVSHHEDLPIKFYTGMRVIGGATGEDPEIALNADWIVLRQVIDSGSWKFMSYVLKNLRRSEYEKIVLPYTDITFENREDPEKHLFRTATGADQVTIYRRIAPVQ